ncbi:FAD-dependent oxidoreductase [Microtetraspora malaysiensis]|uniref:NAD(P)/FAD-dependent oxidoreductase n=1 Tax=Microtetraspora malaysiensis TaxID=161358 RepID=UPI003D8F809D
MDVDIAPMDRVLEMFDRAGIPYEVWDADELARRMPGLDPGRFWPPKRIEDPAFWEDTDKRLGALWTPGAGFVDDPGLAAVNLANSAKRRGAQFLFRRQVIAVLGDGAVNGVRLDDGTTVSAPVVIKAAGELVCQGMPQEVLTKETMRTVFSLDVEIDVKPQSNRPLVIPLRRRPVSLPA